MSENNCQGNLIDIEAEDFILSEAYEELEDLVLKIARIAFIAGKAAQLSEREKDE